MKIWKFNYKKLKIPAKFSRKIFFCNFISFLILHLDFVLRLIYLSESLNFPRSEPY